MPPRRLAVVASAAAAVALTLAAALVLTGGGRPAVTAPEPVPSRAELDGRWAASMLLTADDLPGSTVLSSVPVDGAGTFAAAAGPCAPEDLLIVGHDARRGAATALVRHDPSVTVSSSAAIGQTEAEARSAMAALNAPAFQSCFAGEIRRALLSQARFETVTVSTTALPAMAVGDDAAGYRSTVEAAGEGGTVQVYVDYVFIRSSRALAVLFDLALETPLPDDERVRLASAMADRMVRG